MKLIDAVPSQQLLLAELWADLHDSDSCYLFRRLSPVNKLRLLLQETPVVFGSLCLYISSKYRADNKAYYLDLSCYLNQE